MKRYSPYQLVTTATQMHGGIAVFGARNNGESTTMGVSDLLQ